MVRTVDLSLSSWDFPHNVPFLMLAWSRGLSVNGISGGCFGVVLMLRAFITWKLGGFGRVGLAGVSARAVELHGAGITLWIVIAKSSGIDDSCIEEKL